MKISAVAALLAMTLTSIAAQPGESFAEFTDDGGWCWFADPRVVSHGGKTFAGWVKEDGSIQVGAFDEARGEVQTATLHAKLERDDHDNPGLLVLPDGRLLAIYSEHCGHDMLARVTKTPGQVSRAGCFRPHATHRSRRRSGHDVYLGRPRIQTW